MSLKVLALGGDGIGPEVVDGALRVLEVAAGSIGLKVDLSEDLLHGAAWEKYGTFIRPETLQKAHASDALLVGAVGGPRWDHIVIDGGPEEQDGLMKLRHELDVFACVRHSRAWEALLGRTPFLPDRVRGADIIVMRELCGGAMFTKNRGVDIAPGGDRRAYDLNEYSSSEIERFARVGFEVARRRNGRIISVDKSNVFMACKLWREVVEEIGRSEFPDVELVHYFTDNAIYQMCCHPTAFDVILAENLFGDLLSDQSAAIAGSLGMLPSACLPNLPKQGPVSGPAIYEPVHCSAPDIEGQGIANPVGAILSVAMMLQYSAGEGKCAKRIEAAVEGALNAGYVTKDLGGSHTTMEMTDGVIKQFRAL
ncbi:MAG: 3-isopropylmalate dehydrogenase [Gammaproteobacteria bacterium]|nr:3-isopropylmalate dehydrogenase [Gammaproteobacteria bacterium]